MAESSKRDLGILAGRAWLGVIGMLAGGALWFLAERLDAYVSNPQAYLFIFALAAGYFGALMALSGSMTLARALPAALPPALAAAGLLAWASLRFDTTAAFLARPEPLIAYLIVLVLPLPFLIAALRPGTHWRHYPTLFAESWGIVLRIGGAALFAGIVWLTVFLSDELLKLVDIDIIERLMQVDYAPATFTGLVTGLSLAIVNELRDHASASLVLRLLRLLVPPALVVVGLFTLAIPVRGLGTLFGSLSPSATLLAMALGLAVLVSTSVDAEDGSAARSTAMRLATRGLALLLPVLAVLALEGLRLRIAETGLSPARLAAGVSGAVLLGYGLLYALSVLSGRRWMARIRAANAWMALLVIALAALWLTPLLNAERLSANDQFARFEAGGGSAERLDLWTLQHEWGRAGRDALRRLEALAAGHPEEARLRERLELVAIAPDRGAFENVPRDPATLGARAALKATMPVQPPEAAAEFDRYVLPWYAGSVASFLDGCRDATASGRPGCVLVVHDLIPDNPGNEAILFYKSFGLLRGEVIVPEPVFRRADASEVFSVPSPDYTETDALIEALQDGGYSTGPARINAITIGPRQYTLPY